MAKLTLTYAGLTYLDRTTALQTGDVTPDGIDLNFVSTNNVSDLFRRMCQHPDYQSSEMSFSSYMMLKSRNDDRLIAIPVFPSRVFRHGYVFVNKASGIERPEDLAGRGVGVSEYQQTAALWIRAFLQHDHGVPASSIRWYQGPLDHRPYSARLEHRLPDDVRLEQIPAGRTVWEMLEAGDLDAVASARVPDGFKGESANVRRLFPNYSEVEKEYFVRTGFFPIMHLVVLRRDVYEENRWIAVSLLDAFIEAKRAGMRRMWETGALAVGFPWMGESLEELDDVFDGDAFPYGVPRNTDILEAMLQYSFEQGLSSRKLDLEECFAAETWDHPGG